jgi:predicted PurR-regulated permease PerM
VNAYLNLSGPMRWGINALLLLGLIFALYLGQSILIPMTIALLLAAMLWPAAKWMHGGVPILRLLPSEKGFPWVSPRLVTHKVPWVLACTFMIVFLITVVLLIPIGFGLAFSKMLQEIPRDEQGQQDIYTEFRHRVEVVSPPLAETYFPPKAQDFRLFQAVTNILDPEKPYFLDVLKYIAGYGGGWLWEGVLIMFMLLFLMLEGRMLSLRVAEIFGPSAEAQAKAVKVLEDMATQVRTYVVWRTIVNFALAIVLGLFYSYMGLRHPWPWALLTALLFYIPYLGQIVACVPPVLDAFIYCSTPWLAVVVLVFYIVAVVIEGYVVVPVVMGRPMQLNATTVLLACLFWHLVWGAQGLFLAMPLMAAIKAICANVPGWEAWGNLMSTREPEPPPKGVPDIVDLTDTEVLSPEEALAHRLALEELEKARQRHG